mmetsp:Transcript_83454/g.153226  ORF Transcript_83454/g.153226 Transcript_83454/m.153226 type:complete len:585 (-) Transcript_83454:7-1761(-)
MRVSLADINAALPKSSKLEVAERNAAAPLMRAYPAGARSRQAAEAAKKASKSVSSTRHGVVGCQEVFDWAAMLWPMLVTNVFIMCRGYLEVPVVDEGKYVEDLSNAALLVAPVGVVIGGLASPLVTFCGNALGAGNLRLCGIWLQLALLMQTVSLVLMVPTFWFGGDLMTTVIGDQVDTDRVNIFSRISLASSLTSVWCLSLTSFLVAHQQLMPQLFASAVSLVLGFIWRSFLSSWTWTFLDGQSTNFTDVWAPFACNLAQLLSIWSLSQADGGLPHISPGLHWLFCLEGSRVPTYLSMALPMIFMVALENGKLQAVVHMSSQLGDNAMAMHDMAMRGFLGFVAFLSPLVGVTQAMVSRQLGRGDGDMACQLVWYVLAPTCILVIITVICCAVAVQNLDIWSSSQPAVQQGLTEVVPLVAAACCVTTVLYAGMGVLSACARVFWILKSFFIGAWCITIPFAWYLAFSAPSWTVRWMSLSQAEESTCRLLGIWLAICVGYFVTAVLLTIGVLRSDWTALAKEAQQRSEVEMPGALKAVEEVELAQMHQASDQYEVQPYSESSDSEVEVQNLREAAIYGGESALHL